MNCDCDETIRQDGPFVTKTTASRSGNCNACNNGRERVYEVRMGGQLVRFCAKCRDLLIAEFRRAG